MGENGIPVTRRRFLEMVGMIGGSAALYDTMVAMGMIMPPDPWSGLPKMEAGSGAGKTVLILGAGIGGLTAAYLLDQADYRVEVLEALDRPGGRSLTARRGTVIEQQGHDDQVCEFDKGLYLNMGPGRLPYHHRRVLHFCQLLGVPLEVYVMETTANLFQTPQAFAGQATVNRQIANDTRGYVAELLAKAVRKGALDEELGGAELDWTKNQLLCMLKVFGDLGVNDACHQAGKDVEACCSCGGGCDKSCGRCVECGRLVPDCFDFTGTTRAGCAAPPEVDRPCAPTPPIPLRELLRSEFWRHRFYQPVEYEWQPTLFQPVGGMDEIVWAFMRKIGHLVEFQSVVKKIDLSGDRVAVTYRDHLTGDLLTKRADYCISNIPLPILGTTKENQRSEIMLEGFTKDYLDAVKQAHFEDAAKVGWQANERFWENDQTQIYGGISWIDDIITQMWYPSNDYFTANGTLTGAYIYGQQATRFGDLDLGARLRVAREGAKRLHPEFGSDAIVPQSKGVSIVWDQVPFQAGGWPDWNADSEEDRKAYERLLKPDKGRFFVVGDQESTLPGWQEGAMMSAEHVVELIHGIRTLEDIEPVERAPSTRRLTQGRF